MPKNNLKLSTLLSDEYSTLEDMEEITPSETITSLDPMDFEQWQYKAKGNVLLIKGSRPAIETAISKFNPQYDKFLDELLVEYAGKKSIVSREMILKISSELEWFGFEKLTIGSVNEALHLQGYKNSMDSAVSWGESLKWDGINRSDTFMEIYFGVDVSDENGNRDEAKAAYARAVGKYILSAMGGRLINPDGVKADMVVALWGLQGMRKSTGVSALSPFPDAFSEINLHSKDADISRELVGKIIAEMGELRGIKSKEAEDIKQWLSKTHDQWVPKYEEKAVRRARRFTVWATTNDKGFLGDITGNRRWLPMDVVRLVDTEAIERDRDMIWAEAIQLYKTNGVVWEQAENLASDIHSEYMANDVWDEAVMVWLASKYDQKTGLFDKKSYVQITEILLYALQIDVKYHDKKLEMRLAKILSRLGFEKKTRTKKRISGWSIIPNKEAPLWLLEESKKYPQKKI